MLDSSLSVTTSTLLDGLLDKANHDAWQTFDRRYRPIVLGVLRRSGLGDADAADLSQEILLVFLRAYSDGKYDRKAGRLRHWIATIARRRMIDFFRQRSPLDSARGLSGAVDVPGDDEFERAWEAEHCAHVARCALEHLRHSTESQSTAMRAFELYALEQRPAAEVAEELGIAVSTVYVHANRCRARLRELEAELGATFDERRVG